MQAKVDRLYFADNLRVCIIMLVVAHHAAQAYGPTGGVWPIKNTETIGLLNPFLGVNAAFLMGVMFLISGFFTAASFARKSVGDFFKSRFMRIGIPLCIVSLLVNFPITYTLSEANISFTEYLTQPGLWNGQLIYSHLWFLGHLLVYAVIYVLLYPLIRRVTSNTQRHDVEKTHSLQHWHLMGYVLALWIVSTIIRWWFPIDRWIFVGVPFELAHLPQYISLFFFGTLAFHNNWFTTVSAKIGMVWFWIGLIGSVLVYVFAFMDLPTVFWELWEALIVTGFCVGLLTLFREKFNVQGIFLKKLSSGSYGVYIIHLYIVLALQAVVHTLVISALVKFVFVAIFGIAISYAISLLLKMIPGVKRIL